jgi:hypothetical protein
MSYLRSAEGCMRRAHLDRTAGVPADGDALTGSLWHACAASIGFTAVMRGTERVDVDEALLIARRVLAHPSEVGPLPRESYATVLDLIERWVRRPETRFRTGTVFEVLSERPLAGWRLSARLDSVRRDGPVSEVTDFKTGFGDVGTRLTLQGEVYAWHEFEADPALEVVVYDEAHIRFGVRNGPYEITRDDVYGPGGIQEFLVDALVRLDEAYSAGVLPATPGSACSSPTGCPHAGSCPVPGEHRPDTTIESDEQAAEALGVVLVLEQRRALATKALSGHLKRTGQRAVQVGGEEYGVAADAGSKLDRKQLEADVAAGVEITDLGVYVVPTRPSMGRRKAL